MGQNNGCTTIGLVADTHESENHCQLLNVLREQECDINVHLGDIAGSPLVSKAIREYKGSGGSLAHLSDTQRQSFDTLVAAGRGPMRAYVEVVLDHSDEARAARAKETSTNFFQVLAAMATMSEPYCLLGNVDRVLERTRAIDPDIVDGISLIRQPRCIDLGKDLIVLLPSLKSSFEEASNALDYLMPQCVERRRVVFLAHEQLFKGPTPAVYTTRVRASGQTCVNIPWYEPNPKASEILSLVSRLPASTEAILVCGHMHDPRHVIEAGIPYLRPDQTGAWAYRVPTELRHNSINGRNRRTLRHFYVPLDEVAVLTLGDDRLRWEVVRP